MSCRADFRFWTARFIRVRGCALLAAALLAPLCLSQETEPRAGTPALETPPRPPQVIPVRINAISVFGEGDLYKMSNSGSPLSVPSLWLHAGGVTGDVAVGFGLRTQFTAGYFGGYSYNSRYSELNGANHTVWFELATDPGRRTIFTAGARGESGLISDALFDPSYLLSVAQHAQSLDQLSAGVLNATAVSRLDSAVDLALSGGRRRAGAAYATVSHMFSRRLTAAARIEAMRALHSYSSDLQVASRYPNTTSEMANLDLGYSLSPRTRLHGMAGYARSGSRDYRAEWQSGGLGVERQFGRSSFGSLQAGYVRMKDSGTNGFGMSSYTVSGAYGITRGYHTFTTLVRRGVGDFHGLESRSTIEGDAAWVWAPHATPWRLSGSLGYERAAGGTLRALDAWVGQAGAVRMLGTHFELAFTGFYLSYATPDVTGLTRSGLRIALVWTPTPRRQR